MAFRLIILQLSPKSYSFGHYFCVPRKVYSPEALLKTDSRSVKADSWSVFGCCAV